MSDEQSRRLIDLHVQDLLNATPEELLEDARALGVDMQAERKRHLDILERATMEVGRARMAGARAALDAQRSDAGRLRAAPARPGVPDARVVTLAARNGTEQSDRDRSTVQDDLDELSAFPKDP